MKIILNFFLIFVLIFSNLYSNNCSEGNFFVDKTQISNPQLPFLENQGQYIHSVKYYAHTFGGTVFITNVGKIVYAISNIYNNKVISKNLGKNTSKFIKGIAFEEVLIPDNIYNIDGVSANVKVNYFKGTDNTKWKKNIPTFRFVDFGEIYNGINVRLKAYGNNVEKLFFIKPGFSSKNIKVRINGANELRINKIGELVVSTKDGFIKFTKPIAYQGNNPVEVAYTVKENEYGFIIGEYDPNEILVIDPLLASTFIGSSGQDDTYEPSVAIDKIGNVYLSGYTYSLNFPTTTGAYNEEFNGGTIDRFISKFDNKLSILLASTLIGGSGFDLGMGIGLDDSGNVYIAGYTTSSDFPVNTNSYDNNYNGGRDVYVAKFDNTLSSLISSTYLGGSGNEGQQWPRIDLTIGNSGNIYIAGLTRSSNFPVCTTAYDKTYNGGAIGGDVFLAKFDNNITTLLASTYIGGSGNEWRVSVATDNYENVFICGETESSDYPATSAVYDRTFNGW